MWGVGPFCTTDTHWRGFCNHFACWPQHCPFLTNSGHKTPERSWQQNLQHHAAAGMPVPVLGIPANTRLAHTRGLACSRAPCRRHQPAEAQTAAPEPCEQEKTEKPAPWHRSFRWTECLCHRFSIQRTSQCPQAAAGWRLRSAWTATPSKSCRLS